MKKNFIVIISLSLLSCHQPNPFEGLNYPPHTPNVIYPPNGGTAISIDANFEWSGGDPDSGDIVSYDIYLEASNPDPNAVIAADLTVNSYKSENSLQFGKRYYWKIVAKDNKGEQKSSPVWSFRTRYKNNNPPFRPYQPYPANNSTNINIQDIVLQWQGGDPDTFSIVKYDVYWNTSNPPDQLLSSGNSNSSFNLQLLDFGTQYFWKIIAKDDYGKQVEGPVWNFTTEFTIPYLIENFDKYSIGIPPPDSAWVVYGNYNDASITDKVFWGSSGKCCQFIDPTKENSVQLAKKLIEKDVGVLEFVWRVDGSNDFLGMQLFADSPVNANHAGPQISIRGDSLQYFDDWNWKFITNIDSTRWYHIRIIFDCNNQLYNIYVNNELKVSHAGWLGTAVPSLKYIYFLTFDDRTCSGGYVDEIRYYSAGSFLQ